MRSEALFEFLAINHQEWTELIAHYAIDLEEDDEQCRYYQFIPGSRNPVKKLDWKNLFEDALPDYDYDPKYITDIVLDVDMDLLTKGSLDFLRYNIMDSLDRLDILDLERTIPELIAFDWAKHPKGISYPKSSKHNPSKVLHSHKPKKTINTSWIDDILFTTPAFTFVAKQQKALQLLTTIFFHENIRVNQKNIAKLTTRLMKQSHQN